jgi:hypothetical protein
MPGGFLLLKFSNSTRILPFLVFLGSWKQHLLLGFPQDQQNDRLALHCVFGGVFMAFCFWVVLLQGIKGISCSSVEYCVLDLFVVVAGGS